MKILGILVCCLVLCFLSIGIADAAWQPTKPVEFVVPAGAGGGADVMARFVSPLISKYNLSPKPFIVINKSGGAGAEGFMYVKGKKGDPHVITLTLSNLFTTPLATGVPFNWKDLTPIARLALDYFVLWVNAEAPYKTAKEYLDAVKKEPEKFLMGGTGTAQEDQIITIMMEQAFGLKFTYVPFQSLGHKNLELIKGEIEDLPVVNGAVKGIDVIVHLAWSFSDDPMELLTSDLKGHILLLDAAVAAKISHFFYTSTAVVYGKPIKSPITEEDPCLVEEARKPFYGIAKLIAEKLSLVYSRNKGLPVTIFRFWWSYGEEIGGRHLRDLIKLAQAGEPLMVPKGAGGSFLHLDDLTNAILMALQKPKTFGEIFNLSTLFLSWEEVTRIIIDVTNSSSPLEVIPAREWKGPTFLADIWEVSTDKAERLFSFQSVVSHLTAKQRLKEAIARCYRDMK